MKQCIVDSCVILPLAQGLCNLHYKRQRRLGTTELLVVSIEDRFWAKVDFRVGHGFWTGAKLTGGYGVFQLSARQQVTAHRAYLIITTGEDRKGWDAGHLCEFKDCVIHVEWQTRKENIQQWAATITHCPYGHEYTESNTYFDRAGCRSCRACHREDMARLRANRKGVMYA